jgi:hypothetical protein
MVDLGVVLIIITNDGALVFKFANKSHALEWVFF